MAESLQKYLLLKGCAGLGNRIFCLMEAIHYAERNGRHLIIDWNDGLYFPKGYNFFNDYFTLDKTNYSSPPSSELNTENYPSTSCFPQIFQNQIEADIYDHYVQVRNPFTIKIAKKIGIRGKLRGHWMEKRYYKGTGKLSVLKFLISACRRNNLALGEYLADGLKSDMLIFADYTPDFRPNLFQERFRFSDRFQARLNSKPETEVVRNSIGIHVRNTDLKPTKDIKNLVTFLKLNHEGQAIFLATDSKSVEELFHANFAKIITHEKVLQMNEDAIHKSTGTIHQHINSKVDFENSLTDLYYLSQSKLLYYQGNSSFSIIAQNMNKNLSVDWLKLNI